MKNKEIVCKLELEKDRRKMSLVIPDTIEKT